MIKAFAPGNISCIFVIKKTKNPTKSGSLGVGFTVNKGILVSIKKLNDSKINKTKNENNKINIIYFNNKKIKLPTVNSVVKKLTNQKVEIKIKSELPLGGGFGLSGASSLATAYAVNKLFDLNKNKRELALIAHIAEVENGTGLGDVVNQYYGGIIVKYEPSYMFKVRKIAIKNKKIYYKYFSKIDTKKIISNRKLKNRINKAGTKALNKIKVLNKEEINLKDLIRISKEFSLKSNLMKNKKIINLIKNIEKNKGNASMIMLGNAVFSDKYFKGSKELIIKDKGAYLL